MNKSQTRITNEKILTGLYEEYYDKISRYIFVHTGDRTESEDLASDVFIRALDRLDDFEQRGIPMQAWLFKIAHNLMVDYLRKNSKRKTMPIDAIEVSSSENIERNVEKSLNLETVDEAMKNLTASQREVINLRFFSGLSSKEVGQLLGKSDGAVREMQRAAVESLRKSLVKE